MSRIKNFYRHFFVVCPLLSGVIHPALLLTSCAQHNSSDEIEVQTQISLSVKSESKVETLDDEVGLLHSDIFIFNNDELARLDAFQRMESYSFKTASREGEKILVAITNAPCERNDWRAINSYSGLYKEKALLQNEDPSYPVMSGECIIEAGSGESYTVEITRIMSRVYINSLCADFYGTEFDGEPLEDVKIYLTNVNASCAYLQTEDFKPVLLVNQGKLDELSFEDFVHPEMVYVELDHVLDSAISYDAISLYCYPNNIEEESYGSPFTRLVIEGSIRGQVCYYPITLNREENGVCFGTDGDGIARNCTYSLDITLTRFGTDDPDKPVSKAEVNVVCTIQDWDEKENQNINF